MSNWPSGEDCTVHNMEYYTLEMKTNAAVNEDANFTNVEKLLIFVPQKSPTVFLGRPLGTAAFLNEVLTDIGWGGVGGGVHRDQRQYSTSAPA